MEEAAAWEEDKEDVWAGPEPANFFADLHERVDSALATYDGFPLGKDYILDVLETIPPTWAVAPVDQLEEVGIKAPEDPEMEEKFQNIWKSKQTEEVIKAREFYDKEFWECAEDQVRTAMFHETDEAEEGVEKERVVMVPGVGLKTVPVPGDKCAHCHHVVEPDVKEDEDWLLTEYPTVERPQQKEEHFMDPFLGIDPQDADIKEVEEEERKRDDRRKELGGDKKEKEADKGRLKPEEEEELWKDPRKFEMSTWFKTKMTHKFADTMSEGTQTEKMTLMDDEVRTLAKDIKALRLEFGSKGKRCIDHLLRDRIPNEEVPTMKDFDAIFSKKDPAVSPPPGGEAPKKAPIKMDRKQQELYEAQCKARPRPEVELTLEEISSVSKFIDIRGEKVVLRRDLENDEMPVIETRLRDIFKCNLVIQDTHVPARRKLIITKEQPMPTTSKAPAPKEERKKKHDERSHRNKSKHLSKRKDRGKDLGGLK